MTAEAEKVIQYTYLVDTEQHVETEGRTSRAELYDVAATLLSDVLVALDLDEAGS